MPLKPAFDRVSARVRPEDEDVKEFDGSDGSKELFWTEKTPTKSGDLLAGFFYPCRAGHHSCSHPETQRLAEVVLQLVSA